jgi:hypothetical protein
MITTAEREGLLSRAYAYAFPDDDNDPRPEWQALCHYVDLIMQERADTAFLVGANFGRESERERIVKDIEAAIGPTMWERDIYVNDGLRDAAKIARTKP